MQSMQGKGSDLRRTMAISGAQCRYRRIKDLKQRAKNDTALIVVIVVVAALYAATFVGIYRWIHYHPVLPVNNQPEAPELNQPSQ